MKLFLGIAALLFLMVYTHGIPAHVVSMSEEKVNNRPIIGILTLEVDPILLEYGDEYIDANYVRWLESAGARVVPIRGNQPFEYYQTIFKNTNGVLFPGGGANLTESPYLTSAKYMFDMALEANKRGDYFPIWGTCLGLETFSVLVSGEFLLQHTDSKNITMHLNFTRGFRDSRLFRRVPSSIEHYLSSEPVAQNNHQWSLLVKDFEGNANLTKFFKLLSTNRGRDNLEFVSTLEAYDYPFYTSQWHPEKNIYKWDVESDVDHSFHAVLVGQYAANFFVNEARKNNHHYDSADDEARHLIENVKRVFIPDEHFLTAYYFTYA